jgi:transglutaminase-like putative cysteine protease
MSWRLRIRHSTRYAYEGVVEASYNEARISPLDTPSQFTLEHRVEVNPAAGLYRYRDYWGSRVHAFDIHEPHRELVVTGVSLVETADRTPTLDHDVSWDELDAPGPTDRFCEYLIGTPITESDDAVRAVAAEMRAQPTPAAAVRGTSEWIRTNLEYRTGWTTVSTTAAEALRARVGVCQDFVHLGLGILRAAGIPARYASGYLYPEANGDIGRAQQGQSHAWLEAWVGDWYPIDPTSGDPVAARHVLVARGRDYSDVTPLKGVYTGSAGQSTITVSVDLTRVA